jgi:pimeloyl-ACP methyl ester carboxylesterase
LRRLPHWLNTADLYLTIHFPNLRGIKLDIKTLKTPGDLTLTYYRAGSGPEFIVIVNAPGMSVEFWSWVVRELQNDHSVLAFDYRGFPDAGSIFSDDELSFDDLVADLSAILAHEGVSAAHFVSWASGAKLAFEFQRRFPEKVLSLTAIAMDDDVLGSKASSRFSQAVLSVKRHLDAFPESINSVTKAIRRIGAPSGINLFLTALRGEDLKPVLNLMDMLVMESSMSNLALHLLERPEGLSNYLKLYETFSSFEVNTDFENIEVPVVIVEGECDGLAAISPKLRSKLGSIEEVNWETLENASHFLPMEYPEKTANIIRSAVGKAELALLISTTA